MARVLAIDDDPVVLETLKNGLEFLGHEVLTAETAKVGYRQAFWKKVDAVLLDIVMPEMDGLKLLKKLKRSARTSHIPIVILTGYNLPEFREEALAEYAEFFVLKTASMEEISSRLNQAIAAGLPAPKGLLSLCRW